MDSGSNFHLRDMTEMGTCSICMELYTDPRILTCKHTFCLACLLDMQKTSASIPCPLCRSPTIPGRDQLRGLEPNSPVSDLVAMLYRRGKQPHLYLCKHNASCRRLIANAFLKGYVKGEDDSKRPQTSTKARLSAAQEQSNITSSRESANLNNQPSKSNPPPYAHNQPSQQSQASMDEMMAYLNRYRAGNGAGAQSTSQTSQHQQRPPVPPKPQHQQRKSPPTSAQPTRVTSPTSGRPRRSSSPEIDGAALLAMLLSSLSADDTGTHTGVQCDHCGRSNLTGTRYKCGVCPDYDLCEKCEALPRGEVHSRLHFFIKLKRRQTRTVPETNVLQLPRALELAKTQDFTSRKHTVTIDPLMALLVGVPVALGTVAINCDRCGSTIVGVRYVCGICESYDLCSNCEQMSERFHDRDHVFIKIPHPVQSLKTGKLLRYAFY